MHISLFFSFKQTSSMVDIRVIYTVDLMSVMYCYFQLLGPESTVNSIIKERQRSNLNVDTMTSDNPPPPVIRRDLSWKLTMCEL